MGSGARLRGMVNRCESPQPSLSGTSQRMLTGLNQNGTWSDGPLFYSGHMDGDTTGG